MSEEYIWAMFYAGLVSMRFHPRNENVVVSLELELAAEVADRMVLQWKERYNAVDRSFDRSGG